MTPLPYNRARYYTTEAGRFISADPADIEAAASSSTSTPQGSWPKMTDPTGFAAERAPHPSEAPGGLRRLSMRMVIAGATGAFCAGYTGGRLFSGQSISGSRYSAVISTNLRIHLGALAGIALVVMGAAVRIHLGALAGIALVVMGAADLLRRSATGVIAAVLFVIEACAVLIAIGAIFGWARLTEGPAREDVRRRGPNERRHRRTFNWSRNHHGEPQ